MVVLSSSLFQSVLDRMADEAPEAEDDDIPSASVRGLKSGFVADIGKSISTPAEAGSAYRDLDFIREMEPVPMPEHLGRLSPEDVAADLAIGAEDTQTDLAQRRRAFARLNHPDQVDPAYADKANIRMMIANRLVDEALDRLAAGNKD